jgi:hypothetical protein
MKHARWIFLFSMLAAIVTLVIAFQAPAAQSQTTEHKTIDHLTNFDTGILAEFDSRLATHGFVRISVPYGGLDTEVNYNDLKVQLELENEVPEPRIFRIHGFDDHLIAAWCLPDSAHMGMYWISSTGKTHYEDCRYYGVGEAGTFSEFGTTQRCLICFSPHKSNPE